MKSEGPFSFELVFSQFASASSLFLDNPMLPCILTAAWEFISIVILMDYATLMHKSREAWSEWLIFQGMAGTKR
jgi:hypothetical protein